MVSDTSALRRGTLLLLAAAVLWSLNGVLIKELYAGGLGGCGIACYRSLLGAAVLAPLALRRWKPLPEPGWTAATVAFFTGMCITFVLATTLTSAANAIILQYTAPAWVFLLSPWLLGERTETRQWAAFGLSMSAIGLIFAAQFTSDRLGLGVSLASGLVFGCQCVLFRKVRALDPVILAFLNCAGSGVVLLVPTLLLEGFRMAGTTAAVLAFMAVVQFALPYVLYAAGARYVSAQRAILLVMLEPVLNPVWVFLWRGERPHWSTILGGVLILLSVAYLSLARTRPVKANRAETTSPT